MTTSDQVILPAEREYRFEPFRFIPAQQLLLYRDTPVRLGGRALDILAELVERPGELVSKRELMARAWPRTVVEESNLKVHVAALRRVLDEASSDNRYVATVIGRGYRFVAPVTCNAVQTPTAPPPAEWEQMRQLPAPQTRTTGRADTIDALLRIMRQRRFVSIVGPGGIGKSTVALPLAEAFIAEAGLEIRFVELSPLADPKFVVGAVAAALGLTIHSGDGVQSLIATLRERRLLLVLDSCEHVIDAVAVLVDHLLSGAPELRVLATSREPLRTAGEYVYRLTPLAYPVQDAVLSAAQALAYPSIALFALRAAECLDGYVLSDADAPAVAEICRRLEGIPLAIELAATRMDALGAAELAARLGDCFELLKRGRRGALERHRTLAASLDWSYQLLPDGERALLRALSVFAGAVKLDDATGFYQGAAAATVDGIANLVDKSLLSADVSGACVHYRLLDTTRAYAQEKLGECGETDAMRRRHLEFHRGLFERASDEWDARPGADWLASYGRYLDDVRAALAWSFAPGGPAALGVSLTVAAIPLWMQLSLLEECHDCAERALAFGTEAEPLATCDEMRLRAALGTAALYVSGPVPATEAAWQRVLQLADQQQNREHQLMALWGVAVCRSYAGDLPAVLALAEREQALAEGAGQRAARSAMERLIATALHYSGDQPAARLRLHQLLAQDAPPACNARLARFKLDQRSAALGTLANVLWLQGDAEQAVLTVQASLQQARDSGHAPSLMYAIANSAFPIMLQIGDYAAAEALLAELYGCLKRHAFTLWDTLWTCLDSTLRVLRGDAAAVPLLRQAIGQLRQRRYRPRLAWYLGTLAEAMAAQGQRDAALALIDEALAICATGEERWCHAEMLRIQGTLLERTDMDAAEKLYRQALKIAIPQGALALQLRAASNLARLTGEQLPLRQACGGLNLGFDTADLRRARELLDQPS